MQPAQLYGSAAAAAAAPVPVSWQRTSDTPTVQQIQDRHLHMKEQLFHDSNAAEPHLIRTTPEPNEMQQFIDHRLTDLSRLTMCSAAPTATILAQSEHVPKSKLYHTDDAGDTGYSQLSPKRKISGGDVPINSHSSVVHPVEPDVSPRALLSNQHTDASSADNEHGKEANTCIRDVAVPADVVSTRPLIRDAPVPANAVSTRHLSPARMDALPTTKIFSQSITDQRKKPENVISNVSVTADAVPSRQLSPIRRNISPAATTSPPIYDIRSTAVTVRPVPVLAAHPVPTDHPILSVPLILPDLVPHSKVDLPVTSVLPPVPSVPLLSHADTVRANDTPTPTKRCASVTAALTAAAAATAATKRLTARNKLICLSSSMDIDDKPPHEFMSLSLSPPLNRRREMPALRGPFVSL